ncbi:MAG: T9SS type A sorting domain-containing protein [Saprospiraceae bacterium]
MITRITLLFASLSLSITVLFAQQTLNETVDVGGTTRSYIVYIPAMYDAAVPTPLMFNFHGFTQQASSFMNSSAMREVADTAGFILVYPQGSSFFGAPHWNVGAWTNGSTADDLGFTEAMIDALDAAYSIDLNRVYSCGYSNGGYFSYELACQLSDRIAAIGSVGGKMSSETFNACDPEHLMPVVSIHGTADGTVAYATSAPSNSKTIAETNEYWIDFNSLPSNTTLTALPDTDPNDGSMVDLLSFSDGCSAVDHYRVVGGGHDWVGVRGNMDIDASSVIWNFVSQYTLDGLIGCSPVSSVSESAFAKTPHIYPNPTSGLVTIDMELTEAVNCDIFNLTGQLVSSRKIGPSNKTIDVSELTKGVYFLAVGGERVRLVRG